MKTWNRIEPTTVQKVGWRTITSKTFIMPNGDVQVYDTNEREGVHSAATIALTTDGQIIVARQFRPGPEKVMDELPGGGVEAHEADDFAAAAARELREETGYVPGRLTHLGDVHKDAYTNAIHHYFLAEACTLHPDGQLLDEHEYIDVQLISIERLFENARSGLMTDTEALLLAYEYLRAIQEESTAKP